MSMELCEAGQTGLVADMLDNTVAGNHAGTLFGALVALLQGPIPTTGAVVWADVTEAAFTGYARSGAVAWGAPYLDTDGRTNVDGGGHTFVMTDTVAPESISGAALVKVTGGVVSLIALDAFAGPVNLAVAGQGLTYLPSLTVPFAGWGAGALIS